MDYIDNNALIVDFKETDNILHDIQGIIDSAQQYAHRAVNIALVQRNWLIGYRIAAVSYTHLVVLKYVYINFTYEIHILAYCILYKELITSNSAILYII